MKIQTLGWLVGFSAMASSFLSCTQAKTVCTVGHAGSFIPYVVQMTPVSPPACAAMTTTPSANSSIGGPVTLDKMTSDWVGMETYHPTTMIGDEVQPDFSKGSVAIMSDSLGNLPSSWPDPDKTDADPADKLYSLGNWTAAEPDTNDFCQVPSFSNQAIQKLGTVDGVKGDPNAMPDPIDEVDCVPGVDVKYDWSNVQIYVTAASQGTQFSADLKYTQTTHGAPNAMSPWTCDATPDASQVSYKVRGLWPQVSCAMEVPDPTAMDPDHTKFVANDEMCCPDANPDPAAGRPVGSGINPDFPTKCDPVLLTCVLDAPFDAPLPILGGSKLQICKDLAVANK